MVPAAWGIAIVPAAGPQPLPAMPYTRNAARRPRRHIITPAALERANAAVTREMNVLGLWTPRLDDVEVLLVPLGIDAYGWFSGDIHIPCVSGAQLVDLLRGHHTRLTDILRHEWAHALAEACPRLVSSRRFTAAFGASYEGGRMVQSYHPSHHVTRYAATLPCEDFAEVFHHYLRHKGRVPLHLAAKPAILRKWRFVAALAGRLAAGRHGW